MLRNTFLTHVSQETSGRFPACSEVTLPQLKHLVKTRIALMYQKWTMLHYYTRNMKCKGNEGSACKGAFPKPTQTAAIVQPFPWKVALPTLSAFHLRLLHNKRPWNNWGKATVCIHAAPHTATSPKRTTRSSDLLTRSSKVRANVKLCGVDRIQCKSWSKRVGAVQNAVVDCTERSTEFEGRRQKRVQWRWKSLKFQFVRACTETKMHSSTKEKCLKGMYSLPQKALLVAYKEKCRQI